MICIFLRWVLFWFVLRRMCFYNLFKRSCVHLLVVSDVLGTATCWKHSLIFVLFTTIKAVGMHSSQVEETDVKFRFNWEWRFTFDPLLLIWRGLDLNLLNLVYEIAFNAFLRVKDLSDQLFTKFIIKSYLLFWQWRSNSDCVLAPLWETSCWVQLKATYLNWGTDLFQSLFTIMICTEACPCQPLKLIVSDWLTHGKMDKTI